MTEPGNSLFTATQIARALGIKRQAVQRLLSGILPSGQLIVKGRTANAWMISALPAHSQELLATRAQGSGFRNAEQLLRAPAGRWEPPFPLAEVAQDCLDRAVKLQGALRRSLELQDDLTVSSADLERIGLEDYQREFGHAITGRHLRNLVNRTLGRDGGAGQFARLELFLDERPARKDATRPAISLAVQTEFRELRQVIASFKNPAEPTAAERSCLWLKTVELFYGLCAQGAARAKLRRRMIDFLYASTPGIAASESALQKSFRRKLLAWQTEQTAECLADKRLAGESGPEKRKAKPYNPDQIGLVKYYAATRTGGRRAQAIRELDEQGMITDPRLKQSIDIRVGKSQLPNSFRKRLSDVPAWRVVYIGPRATKKMTPSLKLTFNGLHSMGMITGDDKTLDLYVGIPDGAGWFEMLRPQLLLFVDVKSMFALGRSILPRSQYTAIDTWAGFKTVAMKWGLPKFVLREGGLWRKSKLVNSLASVGNPDRSFSGPEIEYGLSRKGVQFVSDDEPTIARLESVGIQFREAFAAGAKIVERVIGIFSDQCEKLPGYCGRDERIDCPEQTKKNVALVGSRKAHPDELGFLTWPELVAAIDGILNKYNKEQQDGYRLAIPQTGAPMSPEQAFELYRNTEDPPIGFDSECNVLLARVHIPDVLVKVPDLRRRRFPCGYAKVRGNIYCNEETGRRIGHKLTAHFDPLTPETCTFTDELGGDHFTVPKLEDVNGWVMDEQTKVSLAQARQPIAALKADYRAMQAKFEPLLRRNIVSADTAALSVEAKAGPARLAAKRQQDGQRQAKVSKVYSRLRMVPPENAARRPGMVEAAEQLDKLLKEEETT